MKNYQGGDVLLNAEKQIYIKVSEHPELNKYIGSDLITTDGTSVLGADNKAAVANLMVALETIIKENRPHGEIYVAFVPDEEVGLCGSKKMDFSKFPVEFAYTIDCCELGEVVYQTFNAGSAHIKIKGVLWLTRRWLPLISSTASTECRLRSTPRALRALSGYRQVNPTLRKQLWISKSATITKRCMKHARSSSVMLWNMYRPRIRRPALS